ncbi:MAG TPA: HAMP domain-containing sensor histidine kinase [Marmoricola sp.]|nr:HAMP domain-containing sensor histidine kinase [Marmoricola sp.]
MGTDVAAALSGLVGWRDDLAVVLLGCAAALFVVAGVVRLARWRLAGDPHSALVGSALIVMGGLYLPLVGIARVGGALSHRDVGEALVRALVTTIAVVLVLRGMHMTTVRALDRPTRLLPLLSVTVLAVFVALAAGEAALPHPLPGGPEAARLLSTAMVTGWVALAVVVHVDGSERPWARRASPLFAGLAVAEALYGLRPGSAVSSGAALALCTVVAALAAWSAKRDLEETLRQTARTIGSLSQTLREVRNQAVELTEWRDHLVHDASNAVAGLQAALDVLDARQGSADPAAARLCHAATQEVRHLDHLLHRTPGEPVGPFDAGAVVRSVAVTARALGQELTLHDRSALAIGRPGDLVTVLKNLLVNAARHAPGARVELGVTQVGQQVRVVCWDSGPALGPALADRAFERGVRGSASTGSGLGLYEARALMRGQGGDLVLETAATGKRFVATLPAAAAPAPQRVYGIPVQRRGGTSQHVARVREDASR